MDLNQLTASSTSLKRPKLNGPAQEGFEPSVICAPAPHVPVADSELGVVPAAIRQPSGQLPMELLYPPGTPKTNRNAQHADDEARAALSQAAAAYANGDYLHVVTLCRQYCATQPARADVLLLLGAAYYQLRDYRACMDANDAAILLNPLLPEAHCNLANALQQMGNIDLAIMYYASALRLRPTLLDAYANLASAYLQRGMVTNALQTYSAALAIDPNQNEIRCNLADLWRMQGTKSGHSAASKLYNEALARDTRCAMAWRGLGDSAREVGLYEEAIKCYRQAIELAPKSAEAHTGLGLVLRETHRCAESEQAFEMAVQLRPNCAFALGNLAGAQYESGKLEASIDTYKRAVALQPNFPEGLNNLGNVLREAGRLDEAFVQYSISVQLQLAELGTSQGGALPLPGVPLPDGIVAPNDPGLLPGTSFNGVYVGTQLEPGTPRMVASNAVSGSFSASASPPSSSTRVLQLVQRLGVSYTNLAGVLKLQGRAIEAIAAYEMVVALQPSVAEAYANLAAAYKDAGKHEEAVGTYLTALSLRPDFPEATANMVHSMQCVCDWSNRMQLFHRLEAEVRRDLDAGKLPAVQPFHALTYPFTPDLVLDISKGYAKNCLQMARRLPGAPTDGELPHPPLRKLQPGERLRVGYVSSDFGNHPLSHLMGSVFGLHDRSRIEVFCYALSPDDGSDWRRRISIEAEHFIDVSSVTVPEIARRMSADGIHIAVNLNGYTKGARNEVFALRPAPVQVAYMGFPAPMGADYIPWIILDKTVCPPSSRACYSEAVAYMPRTYFVNDYRRSHTDVLDGSAVPTRAEVGLPEDCMVYSCANQLYKLDPDTFDTWCRILHRVPNAVLWLLRFPPAGETRLRLEATARGIHPSRIVFTDVAAKHVHVARSGLADVFLDTPQCNAHTTGCDVLWGGCPMVTLPLQRMASRVGASLCTATGLGKEMVVHSRQEYEDRAVELGLNNAKREALRHALRTARTSCCLFDTPRYVRNLEKLLLQMWDIECEGGGPRDFEIEEDV